MKHALWLYGRAGQNCPAWAYDGQTPFHKLNPHVKPGRLHTRPAALLRLRPLSELASTVRRTKSAKERRILLQTGIHEIDRRVLGAALKASVHDAAYHLHPDNFLTRVNLHETNVADDTRPYLHWMNTSLYRLSGNEALQQEELKLFLECQFANYLEAINPSYTDTRRDHHEYLAGEQLRESIWGVVAQFVSSTVSVTQNFEVAKEFAEKFCQRVPEEFRPDLSKKRWNILLATIRDEQVMHVYGQPRTVSGCDGRRQLDGHRPCSDCPFLSENEQHTRQSDDMNNNVFERDAWAQLYSAYMEAEFPHLHKRLFADRYKRAQYNDLSRSISRLLVVSH